MSRLLFLILTAALALCPLTTSYAEDAAMTYTNPIATQANDPYLIQHGDTYYYIYTKGTYLKVTLVDDPTRLDYYDVTTAKTVYTAPEGTMWSKEYWAPELHYIDGEWYIYVAADDGVNDNHRMYVLKGTSQNPLEPFEMVGKLSDPSDKWAIDGTVLQYKGELYHIWSGWQGDANVQQNLYIAHMSDPCTIDSERVMLSYPSQAWECQVYPINEGPQILLKGDTVHIIYSASASWEDDYCLAALTYRPEQGDIMDPAAWIKTGPLLTKGEQAYGPGHCSLIKSPDGTEDYVIYHANRASHTGWAGRSGRMQRFTWDGDMPVFGEPALCGDKLPLPSGTRR